MQDSPMNPYIPSESPDIREKVYDHQSPLGRIVKWSMIATAVVAFLVGIGLFFVVPRTTAVDQPARVKLADTLQPPDQILKRVDVESSIGFKFNYDNRLYASYAEVGDSTAGTDTSDAIVSGQTYENNDLRILRAYNYVRIRPLQSSDSARALAPLPPELELFATVTDKDITTAQAVPENKGLSKLSMFVKLDSDKRLAKRVADDKTVVTIDATKPVSTTIGNAEYQMVRFTTTNDNHRVSDVKYDECYYTIQYAQPYSICITGVRPTSVSAASLVQQVFGSITYEQPASNNSGAAVGKSAFVFPLKNPQFTLAQSTSPAPTSSSTTDNSSSSDQTPDQTAADGESPLITVTPSYYGDASSLKSIAQNQPSVVRVGMLYCANLSLKFESGETATSITDACTGSLSSGVFVSNDGYIATTGHAIRTQKKAAIDGYINFAPDQDTMLDRLQRILDYLLSAKIILQSDADYLKQGAQTGDQEALAKIQNIASVIPDNFITPVNEEYSYAIEPTDKPIVINKSDSFKPSFAYSDTVLQAKYVASNYDPSKGIQEVFNSATPTADVGLLKIDGNYPEVPIAPAENMHGNDTLNTIGFPAYSDSSVALDQIRNLPIATVSKVDQAYQKDGTRLIQTDTSVLPGNDGAPVFDSTGQLVGFSVYGLTYCPDDSCFSNGTVRSANELLKLLDDNNIKLNTGSAMAADWRSGINEYFRANYASSADFFNQSANMYPFNRWADPLQKLSIGAEGSTYDTSLMNQLQAIMIITLVVLVVLTILLAIVFFLHRRRIGMLQVGHYGTVETAPDPTRLITPTMNQPIQPVQPYFPPPSQLPPIPPQQPNAPVNGSPVINLHGGERPAQPQQPPTPPPYETPSMPIQQPPSDDDKSGDPFYK